MRSLTACCKCYLSVLTSRSDAPLRPLYIRSRVAFQSHTYSSSNNNSSTMFFKISAVVFAVALLGRGSWAQDGRVVQLRVQDASAQARTARPYVTRVAASNTGASAANYGPPQPYEYGYQLDDTNGSHGHVEKRDESGRVEGEYSINLGDGRVRVVKYVADENGYRADVSTDELGTESKNPNDVYIGSTAISGFDAALKYGPFAPPHIEQPLVVAERPSLQTINSQVALPTYGTFAGGHNRQAQGNRG